MVSKKFISKLATVISSLAIKGAKIKRHGRMCNECAFKKGSITQTEPHNIVAAADCVAHYGQFNCHVQGQPGKDAGKPCVGFLHAMEYQKSIEDAK